MPNRNGTTQVSEGRDVGAVVERARDQIEEVAVRAKRTLATVDRTLESKMRENPLLVLGLAVGVGYVIGRIFSRVR